MDTQTSAPEALGLKLYTIKQTLELLSIKRTKLWRLVKDKQLKSIRIGAKRLFTASDIAAFINARREA
jgi:excisionase family DNA binding protein